MDDLSLDTIFSLVAIVGGFIMRDRQVVKMINDKDVKIRELITGESEKFVRSDTMDAKFDSVVSALNLVAEQQRASNQRMDSLLLQISTNDSSRDRT